MEKVELKWKRMSGKVIDEPLITYLDGLLLDEYDKGLFVKVAVGTDSQRKGDGYSFATVILITKHEDLGGGVVVGRGGMVLGANYFNRNFKKNKDGVKERMLFEVSKSIEVAYEISPLLDLHGINLEIHADINADVTWESNKALNEAVGYILGMGYDFKVKPDSHAASNCADKLCQ
jgi:predicted RNase H-related nuclease YkuK (DUF458 family)